MADALGLHLVSHLDLVDSPRRSVLARLDRSARLVSLESAGDDDAVAAMVAASGDGPIAVDAPLAVPNATGRRDAEAVLAWCDIAAFPVSAERLVTVHGGARGVTLAPRLTAGGRMAVEALPDQVLRQIAWEADHPLSEPAVDLAVYRVAWIGVRAPRFRPKGAGRAHPAGILAAWHGLSRVVDTAGWVPGGGTGDWAAIDDAARIDAICCAYAALRLERDEAVRVGAPGRGEIAVPVDANLRARLAATRTRLLGDGAIRG